MIWVILSSLRELYAPDDSLVYEALMPAINYRRTKMKKMKYVSLIFRILIKLFFD